MEMLACTRNAGVHIDLGEYRETLQLRLLQKCYSPKLMDYSQCVI